MSPLTSPPVVLEEAASDVPSPMPLDEMDVDDDAPEQRGGSEGDRPDRDLVEGFPAVSSAERVAGEKSRSRSPGEPVEAARSDPSQPGGDGLVMEAGHEPTETEDESRSSPQPIVVDAPELEAADEPIELGRRVEGAGVQVEDTTPHVDEPSAQAKNASVTVEAFDPHGTKNSANDVEDAEMLAVDGELSLPPLDTAQEGHYSAVASPQSYEDGEMTPSELGPELATPERFRSPDDVPVAETLKLAPIPEEPMHPVPDIVEPLEPVSTVAEPTEHPHCTTELGDPAPVDAEPVKPLLMVAEPVEPPPMVTEPVELPLTVTEPVEPPPVIAEPVELAPAVSESASAELPTDQREIISAPEAPGAPETAPVAETREPTPPPLPPPPKKLTLKDYAERKKKQQAEAEAAARVAAEAEVEREEKERVDREAMQQAERTAAEAEAEVLANAPSTDQAQTMESAAAIQDALVKAAMPEDAAIPAEHLEPEGSHLVPVIPPRDMSPIVVDVSSNIQPPITQPEPVMLNGINGNSLAPKAALEPPLVSHPSVTPPRSLESRLSSPRLEDRLSFQTKMESLDHDHLLTLPPKLRPPTAPLSDRQPHGRHSVVADIPPARSRRSSFALSQEDGEITNSPPPPSGARPPSGPRALRVSQMPSRAPPPNTQAMPNRATFNPPSGPRAAESDVPHERERRRHGGRGRSRWQRNG
jgi:hypothetical protein